MKKILLYLLFAVFTLDISAQAPRKKCPTCGLSMAKCQYKGKHPHKNNNTLTVNRGNSNKTNPYSIAMK